MQISNWPNECVLQLAAPWAKGIHKAWIWGEDQQAWEVGFCGYWGRQLKILGAQGTD